MQSKILFPLRPKKPNIREMSDPFLIVLDSTEAGVRTMLSALAQSKGITPERAKLLRYGIERVEMLLTLCKQTLLLSSTPTVLEASPNQVFPLEIEPRSR